VIEVEIEGLLLCQVSYELNMMLRNRIDSVEVVYKPAMKLGFRNNSHGQCRRASDGITILVRTVVEEKIENLLLPPVPISWIGCYRVVQTV